jgi:uncharacterized protein YegP (UPF0339 family)
MRGPIGNNNHQLGCRSIIKNASPANNNKKTNMGNKQIHYSTQDQTTTFTCRLELNKLPQAASLYSFRPTVVFLYHESIRKQVVPFIEQFTANNNYIYYTCSGYKVHDESENCVESVTMNGGNVRLDHPIEHKIYLYTLCSSMNEPSVQYVEQFKSWCQLINKDCLCVMEQVVFHHQEYLEYVQDRVTIPTSIPQSTNDNIQTKFTRLPDDCLAHIFQYTNIGTWITCSTLNKSFYNMFNNTMINQVIWKTYCDQYLTHCDKQTIALLNTRLYILNYIPKCTEAAVALLTIRPNTHKIWTSRDKRTNDVILKMIQQDLNFETSIGGLTQMTLVSNVK